MTASSTVPRWAVSFADLGLLLLGCFVLLHAMEAARPTAAAGAAMAPARGETLAAESLFEPGEARLTEGGQVQLQALGHSLAESGVEILSRGVGDGGRRLDRFELGAARTAAVARALRESGVAEAAIGLRVESEGPGRSGQFITVARR